LIKDILAAIGAVSGTFACFILFVIGSSGWTMVLAFALSVWCTWLIARESFETRHDFSTKQTRRFYSLGATKKDHPVPSKVAFGENSGPAGPLPPMVSPLQTQNVTMTEDPA
jgi:hypothetical protein